MSVLLVHSNMTAPQAQDPAVQQLQQQVAALSAIVKQPGSLDRYLDPNTKTIIQQIVQDSIIDIVWGKYFYYYTPFEYVGIVGGNGQGWDLNDSSGTLSGAYTSGVQLSTGTTSGDTSSIFKSAPFATSVLSYNVNSRFRTSIFLTGTANQTAYITVGQAATGTDYHYGFKIVGSTLYGIIGKGTSDTSIALATLSANQIVSLEARFSPSTGVTFYSSDPGSTKTKSRGILGPSQTPYFPVGAMNGWLQFMITTNENARKDLNIQFVEYIQPRPSTT